MSTALLIRSVVASQPGICQKRLSCLTVALIAFTDDSHLIGAMRRFHSGFGGNIFDHMTCLGGYNEKVKPDTQPDKDVWLKLEKKGPDFISYCSFDGNTWNEIARENGGVVGTAQPDSLKVGIYASVGSGDNVEINIQFSDFTYIASDGTANLIPFAVDNAAEAPVDRSALSAAISDAKALLSESKVGDLPGQYPQSAIDSLAKVIDEAETILGRTDASQKGVDAAESKLKTAVTDFKNAVITDTGNAELGDIDENGVVNVSDIMTLKALKMNGSWNEKQLSLGDFNKDSKLTVSDILSLKNLIMAS